MRIIVTSDLHYNVARSKEPTRAIAREICALGGDVLVLVGDSAAIDLSVLDEVFALFAPFKGAVLAVAGNHELWTIGAADSLHKYEHDIAEACRRNGVYYLDERPFVAGGLAVVGNVGWYDFTFRPSILKVPLRFYQHKIAPGAAGRLPQYEHLLDHRDDVPPAAMSITTRWMDGQYVRLPIGDVEFTRRLADKLRRHLQQVHDAAERVVACLHHLPFAELVSHSVLPDWEFASAFLGSELLGEVLLDFPKVSHLYCGHTHRALRCRKRQLACLTIGSTYGAKRYEILDL
jgi:predicted phosphohydrolase